MTSFISYPITCKSRTLQIANELSLMECVLFPLNDVPFSYAHERPSPMSVPLLVLHIIIQNCIDKVYVTKCSYYSNNVLCAKEELLKLLTIFFLEEDILWNPKNWLTILQNPHFLKIALTTNFCNAFELVHSNMPLSKKMKVKSSFFCGSNFMLNNFCFSTESFLNSMYNLVAHASFQSLLNWIQLYVCKLSFPMGYGSNTATAAVAVGTLMHLFVCKLATNLLSRNHTFFSTDKLFFPLRASSQ